MTKPLQTALSPLPRIAGLLVAGLLASVAVVGCALFALAMTAVMLVPKARFGALQREPQPDAQTASP